MFTMTQNPYDPPAIPAAPSAATPWLVMVLTTVLLCFATGLAGYYIGYFQAFQDQVIK